MCHRDIKVPNLQARALREGSTRIHLMTKVFYMFLFESVYMKRETLLWSWSSAPVSLMLYWQLSVGRIVNAL